MMSSIDTIEIPINPMVKIVRKWGDSLAITIPKAVANIYGISEGDTVAITVFPLKTGGNGDDQNQNE